MAGRGGALAGGVLTLPTRSEDALLVGTGLGYAVGTALGVHWVGRQQNLSASPWGTGLGVLAGMTLGGALVTEDENGLRQDGATGSEHGVCPSSGGGAPLLQNHRDQAPRTAAMHALGLVEGDPLPEVRGHPDGDPLRHRAQLPLGSIVDLHLGGGDASAEQRRRCRTGSSEELDL